MLLLTKAILADFKKHAQDPDTGNPWVVCKFFNPCGGQSWYMTNIILDIEKPDGEADHILEGYLDGVEFPEWGSIYLSDLKLKLPPLGLPCERDLYFKPCYFEDLKEKGIIKERVY